MSQPCCTCDSNAPTREGPKARVPSQLHSQLCLHVCSTSHIHIHICAPAAFAHVPLPICSFVPTDCKNDDMICFPIHSYSPYAGTALKIYPISTGALLPVLEDGVAPAFPAGPTLAWLPPAALAGHSHHEGDCKGVAVQQESLHHTPHYTVQRSFHL